jgi:tripartite-type tricarboxylate transporter receptor subunit TctC
MKFSEQSRREFLITTLAAAGAAAFPALAQAQAFPSRPVRLICPWGAGGSADNIMRAMAASTGKTLGGSIIVENKPGAAGTLGAIELVNAPPDGYTLSQFSMAVIRVPHMQKVQFDPLKDFTYIICIAGNVFGLVVRVDSPIKSIQDVVQYAKQNPGNFAYGSNGVGTTAHLAMEQFAERAGIKLLHIPYKGDAEGLQAVLGGHVMSYSGSSTWGSHVDAGSVRLLATYGSKRSKRWANVATLTELGYDTVSDSPMGFGGPKGMDPAITKRLHDAFKASLEDPTVMALLDRYDAPVTYLNSADYTKFMRDTYAAEKVTIERLGLAYKAT